MFRSFRRFLCSLASAFTLMVFAARAYPADSETDIDLTQAIALTLRDSPMLRAQGYDLDVQAARVEQAGIRPAPELHVQLENVLGTGENRLLEAAQTTFNIAWVLERGLREARVEAARAGRPVVEGEREVERLDAAAETARRYLNVLLLQARMDQAAQAITLAEEALTASTARTEVGRAPSADVARARAALARRQLDRNDIEHELLSARYRLAAMWGDTSPDFTRPEGDLLRVPAVESYEGLQERLEASPNLALYLSRQRMDEASLRLEQARNRQPWRISSGFRHMELTGDQTFVADISIPLGRQNRNRGRVEEARATVARTQAEADAERVQLETELFVLYQELQHYIQLVTEIADTILPLHEQALAETREAYESGRYTYLEWNAAQEELLAARRDLLEAGAGMHRNLIEIERLTGLSLQKSAF